MRGTSSFDPETLTRALTPLPRRDEKSSDSDPLVAYRDFYDLDYADRVPGLRHTIGWLGSGEHRITVQRFSHPDPVGTAVVCHGYYDHVGLYGHLIEFLLGRRLRVVSFDQPGHGLSSGARATIGSFDEYVQALTDVLAYSERVLPRPWYIIGQSMGGAVTMEFLARQKNPDFQKVVLLAPLIRPANWGLARFAYLAAKYTVKERPRTITDNAENPEFLSLMRRDPLAPMTLPVQWVGAMAAWMKRFEARGALPFDPLVIQGHADETVDWRHNLRVLSEKTRPVLLEIPAARHHLVNESDLIRQQMFDWLAPQLGSD